MNHRLLHKQVLILGAAIPLLAHADPQPEQPQEQGADKLEQIVVTARRREEALQSVPAAVTALTFTQLREQQLQGAADLQRVVSNTTMTDESSIIAGTLTAFIRGIGTDPGFSRALVSTSTTCTCRARWPPTSRSTAMSIASRSSRTAGQPVRPQHDRRRDQVRDPRSGDDAQASLEVRHGAVRPAADDRGFVRTLDRGTLYGDVGVFWKERDGFQTNLYNGQTLGSINQRAVHAVLKRDAAEGISISSEAATASINPIRGRLPSAGTLPAAAAIRNRM